MSIISPCINVCVTDPETDLCYGCSRTTKEITEWSKYNDEEQSKVIEISRKRMDELQRKAFDKAYKEKIEIGTGLLKKQKLQD
tara:strand:- start:81 stop:329 length:249 start_codon:yes stop_codon:yes gene_type:complete